MTPVDRILTRLENPKGRSPKWSAKCPAHEDGSPSLSIKSLDDGRVLIHCHAGCSPTDVLSAIGMSLSDLFPENLGELSGKKFRSAENRLSQDGYANMQQEIYRLRAKLSAR